MFNSTQVLLYDKGAVDCQIVLRIRMTNDLHLGVVGEPLAPGAQVMPATSTVVECIENFSETPVGFERGVLADAAQVLTVKAANVKIPIWTPFPFVTEGFPRSASINGRLSDYLIEINNTWADTSPPLSTVFVTVPNPSGSPIFENEANRHYFFQGILFDFEVVEDGRAVIMRFTEDLRWDRPCPPYLITDKTFRGAPKENLGLPLPIIYGVHGLWAHAGMAPSGQAFGPFSLDKPFFPACLNGGVVYEVKHQPDGLSGTRKHSWHSFGATNTPGYSLPAANSSGNWYAFMVRGEGMPAMIRHTQNSFGVHIDQELISSSSEFDPTGWHDLKTIGRIRMRELFRAATVVFPVKEPDNSSAAPPAGTGPTQGVTSLPSFVTEHAKQTAKIIDGDVFSYLRDDVVTSGTTARRVTWEMGVERNVGSIIQIRPYVIWRRVSGSGNLTLRLATDMQTNATVDLGAIVVTAANSPAGSLITTISDHTAAILGSAAHAERWEFVQRAGTPAPPIGQGMRFSLTWTKATATDVFDIVQSGWLVEFNPSRLFVENREWSKTEAISDPPSLSSGRSYGRVTYVERTGVDRVLSTVVNQRRTGFYLGQGQVADAANGFPGTIPFVGAPAAFPNLIHNPADVIRHLILNYGGGSLDNTLSGSEPIVASELAYQSTTPDARDFDKAAAALKALCAEACGIGGEDFRIALSVGSRSTVKTVVRAIEAAIPGLHTFRYPRNNPAAGFPRGMIGCIFPRVGDTANYRRPISLRNDVEDVAWRFTPPREIVNDIKIQYGPNSSTGALSRQLWYSKDVQEHGFPVNVHGPTGTATSTLIADGGGSAPNGLFYRMVNESASCFGPREMTPLVCPFIYRPHEALAIRNSIIEWKCCSRMRLILTAFLRISDVAPGDVIQLDAQSDEWMDGLRFPMVHLLLPEGSATASSWNNRTFLVERVVYKPGAGDGSRVVIQAIWNGRAFA